MRRINVADDILTGLEGGVEATSLLDFWKWAFSDLCDDDIKGIFAEWLVAKLLSISTQRRISWANSDIITDGKVRIEVKSSAYWQSWKHLNEFNIHYDDSKWIPTERKRIGFSRLAKRDATQVPNKLSKPFLKSHIYVFAFENEKKLENWNAMDLSQWEFYILRSEEIPPTTVTLAWLRKTLKRDRGMNAQEFMKEVPSIIEEVERSISRLDSLKNPI